MGQFRRLPLIERLIVAALLALVGSLLAALGAIIIGMEHWAAWVVVCGLVEPLALFLLLGASYCLFPASPLGRLLMCVYRRARVVIWIVMSSAALASVLGLGWVAWIWLSDSR